MSLISDEEGDLLSISDNDNDHQSDASFSSDNDNEPFPPPPLQTNYFAPPFYGRPPTPLPPSPSLTSLLRPSRPTTPDASDDELEPVPRASPKVPTYEYYGFVLYLFSTLTFLIYLLWAYLPSPFLHALGIYYYPNRWWALAVPAWLVMLIVFIYVALAAYNTEYLTLPLHSVETLVDEAAKVATVDGAGNIRLGPSWKPITEKEASYIDWRNVWNKGTDAVMDVPLSGVNEILYGDSAD
ncbi:PIG-P-domain-containing protein [Hypoxylon rubiginosum]|uniref:PIG-P-domain-containing protein n=1 Tax=Hypoxylon rubiginosum TaxID=110542 RepID=A0ACC0D294_9PEZI|nr:PIG-P-domain-containing protein [Hypoxylon rubiginosum]